MLCSPLELVVPLRCGAMAQQRRPHATRCIVLHHESNPLLGGRGAEYGTPCVTFRPTFPPPPPGRLGWPPADDVESARRSGLPAAPMQHGSERTESEAAAHEASKIPAVKKPSVSLIDSHILKLLDPRRALRRAVTSGAEPRRVRPSGADTRRAPSLRGWEGIKGQK